MPDWLLALIGALVGLLGGAGGLALHQRLGRSTRPAEPPEPAPPAPAPPEVLAASREAHSTVHEERASEVIEAASGDDPEGDLADLLNRRHP